MNCRDGVAPSLMAALLDVCWHVGPDPTSNGVGVLL
jgi:hypothetical protein